MTHTRSWLALGALLAAIISGTVWAQQQKPATPIDPLCEIRCDTDCPATNGKKCCTKEEAKTCCEGKCCTADKGKSCCSDGKCCGCCEKAKDTRTVTLPVPANAAVQVVIEPAPAPPAYQTYDMPPAPALPPYVSTPRPSDPLCNSAPQCPLTPPAPQPTPSLQTTPVMSPGCGSTGVWSCPPMPSVQYTPVTQYVATPCAVPPPPMPASPAPAPWQLRVVEVNHQPRLMMQWTGDNETRASCEEMTVHIGPEPLKVCVADKQIHVSGNFIKGSADTITRNTADGSLLMEGHVKVHYGKEGKKVEVAAEEVVVNMTEGRVEVRGLARAAFPTGLSAPKEGQITPTPPACPACPASHDAALRLFNFWMGLSQ
jgi:hypothetical protein